MKRLLLISPVATSSLMGRGLSFRLPALGPLKVAALTPPGWEMAIMDEKIQPLDLNQGADMVGITAMTPTVNRGYEIADHFRRRGVKVLRGGMHGSKLPEAALAPCGTLVIGEAERLWSSVISDFERGTLSPIYRHERGLPSLEGLPTPDWSLYRDKDYLPVHFVETTCGCPMDCEFCAVTSAFGGGYRNRPQDDVLTELHHLEPFERWLTLKRCVFFVDDNTIADRAYARRFLARIADVGIQWFGQASMSIADEEEILSLCERSGCIGLFIGFESLWEETPRSIGQRVNQPDHYYAVIRPIAAAS